MAGRTERVLALPTFDQGTIFGPESEPKQDVYSVSTSQNHRLGARFVDGDRTFRYQKSAGTIGKANMAQMQVVETKTEAIVQTGHAWSVGDVSGTVLITTGGTFSLNEFTDGWMYANKVAAVGDIYRLMASQIQSSDTIIDLELETPIRTAISVTTEITLHPNRFWDVVIFPAAHTGYASGVPLVDVVSGEFFWGQTAGPCVILGDAGDTLLIGNSVGSPGTAATAGTCGVRTTLEHPWGYVLHINAGDNEPALINLTIDQ